MRGKRSILADITSRYGRQVFEDLVKSVDVIVRNAPDNQIKKMGLDAESLRKLNPDALFCKLDCFGGALSVAAALYQKYRHGRIGRGRTSLSSNSGLLQAPFAYDFKGRGLYDEPSGPENNGYDALRAENTRAADETPGTDNGSYSFSVYPDHPSGHEVTQLDPYAVRAVRGKINAVTPSEKFGASIRTILRELGYADQAIEAMLKSGGVNTSWSDEYLPD